MKMNLLQIYYLIIGIYGFLDLLVQKNSKSVFSSKSNDKTYWPIFISFILTLAALPAEWEFFNKNENIYLAVTGIIICMTATIVRVKGQLDLKNCFSTRIEKQENHVLIKTGSYKIIRHPLYLSILLLMVGANVMLLSYFSWIITGIAFYFIFRRISKEEKFLMDLFTDYSEYMKSTKKVIPYIY